MAIFIANYAARTEIVINRLIGALGAGTRSVRARFLGKTNIRQRTINKLAKQCDHTFPNLFSLVSPRVW